MSRVLAWPGCQNVRDLGGLPTRGGGRVRAGALIRADRPRPETVPALVRAGVGLVADLRLAAECAADPGPLAGSAPWRHLPVLRDEDDVLEEMGETLPAIYRAILDRGAPLFAAVLSAVAHAPVGPVLVHCHSGKDRTGLVAALALAVAGVPESEIAADYALTASCLRWEEHLAALPGEAARSRSRRLFAEVTAETMAATLAHLDERHGGVVAYLLAAGLSPSDLTLLRRRLTSS
ncbi:tyrosine-protein phosphatase [Nonomuraea aridisoli]|uniref:Protein-tyrosine-phosphatase n=1 Tax=Nonomuraea aridisoli TaxID=2070368 RepID=A0A2W2DI00_9ACTN|nr:tyrosine-protein phosphatase [Nonomuraea aridisoli]PZG10101.1 protein-tyrosine-phosphatase [Nonomuraea aridisoli]